MNRSTLRPNPSTSTRTAPRVIAACAILGLFAGTASAETQSWEYKSYRKDKVSGKYSKDNYTTGTIGIEEKDGKAMFKMQAGNLDVCYRAPLPATVTRTEASTVIEVTQPVAGCEQFRYTIANDGSGGFKETREGDGAWRRSTFDHGLTPKKP